MPGSAVGRGAFRDRVQALRDTWEEQREVRAVAASPDLESQHRLLHILHAWACESAATVQAVYGRELDLTVDDLPLRGALSFSVRIGSGMSLTFAIAERRRMGGQAWTVTTLVSTPRRGYPASREPDRRNGPWTRARLENAILSMLGAYERSRSAHPGRRMAPARPAAG